MNKRYFKHAMLYSIGFFISSCGSGAKPAEPINTYAYPTTATVNASNNYFGTVINDPYQWLESTTEPNVLYWVSQQNDFTQNYFNNIPNYPQILAQVTQIFGLSISNTNQKMNFTQQNKTITQGKDKYFYILNEDIETNVMPIIGNKKITHSKDNIIYVTKDKNKSGEVFMDINTMYPNDVISIDQIATFANDQYLVYSLTRNYGDIADLHVVDIASKQEIQVIDNAFSSVNAWESGFFYVKPSNITNPLVSPYNYNLLNYFYVNDNISSDRNVYTGDAYQLVSVEYLDESSERLYITASLDTNNKLFKVDLSSNDWAVNTLIDDDYQHSYSILGTATAESLYITTNNGAKRSRLIMVDVNNPIPSSWQNILPELGSDKIINGISMCGNRFISVDIESGINKISQYESNGVFENNIPLPDNMVTSATQCSTDTDKLTIAYSNLATTTRYMRYDFVTKEESIYYTQTVPTFDETQYVMNKVSVPSTGGAIVDVFLVYKQGLQLNGNNPAYIDAYGGFDYPMMPSFNKRAVFFIENGGVYAVAQVRGGGEQGTSWYNDGRLLNKQNTYTDMASVAEYLIQNGYTNAGKLGVGGRSNGGVTAAASALQRPDLFKVAFPAVGVHDLLRYNLFTLGFSWYYDYGYSSIQEQFNNMITFSPLQNVKAQSYPAMYIQTGQQDTRVPPLHSYKLAATLQNVATGPNPYLLDSYPNLSHFVQNGADAEIKEATRTWAFFFYNTNTPLSTGGVTR